MKRFYLLILLGLTHILTRANPVITAVSSSGNWKTGSTWNLNRVPANGDTVVIPAGDVVTIDNVQNLSSATLYIKIYGTLQFSNGKLWLGPNSAVIIFMGGAL